VGTDAAFKFEDLGTSRWQLGYEITSAPSPNKTATYIELSI
jgi:hypothetical protein